MIGFFQRRNRLGIASGNGLRAVPVLAETLESRKLLSANLLVNGDFSAGNTGFSSQYGVATVPGGYVIAKNPASAYPGTISFGDHTTGTGLMMLTNGSTTGTKSVWQENVPVSRNSTYDFAGFVASFAQKGTNHTDPSPPILTFYVNGVSIGTFNVPATNGSWGRFAALWNSGSSTTASIKIVDRNTASSGNDFAIDDLSFAASPNLLTNGDFSSGFVGFSTQYVKGANPGDYAIAKNPSSVYSGVASFGDHTTGTGSMLLANGASTASPYIWQENVSVASNSNYGFSGFAASFSQLANNHTDPSPAKLAFYVNGAQIGTFSVAGADGAWGKFAATWNSGSSTSATVKIVDLNRVVSGNDFALDDLVFNQK